VIQGKLPFAEIRIWATAAGLISKPSPRAVENFAMSRMRLLALFLALLYSADTGVRWRPALAAA